MSIICTVWSKSIYSNLYTFGRGGYICSYCRPILIQWQANSISNQDCTFMQTGTRWPIEIMYKCKLTYYHVAFWEEKHLNGGCFSVPLVLRLPAKNKEKWFYSNLKLKFLYTLTSTWVIECQWYLPKLLVLQSDIWNFI